MTTIKLTKKPTETPTAGKKPVRHVAPAMRDRTKPPPKPAVRAEHEASTQPKGKTDGRVRGNDGTKSERPQQARQAEKSPRQRNHRFDGSLRENQSSGLAPKPRQEHEQNIHSSNPPKQPKPQGIDTRTTPRPDKNEPQYRQAPRRGGKVRDGYDSQNTPQYGAAAKAAYKSSPVNVEQPRLSKVMAERGLCSRREADDWIVNGWVKVNGEIIDTLGTRIAPDVEIIVSHHAKAEQSENVTILLHKPVGYVSGQAEDGYEPAVVLVKPENQWSEDTAQKSFKRSYLKGLAPAGRLDIDSTGLLVLTQDGRIARHLIGEDSSIEKEYLVRVEGELSAQGLAKLNHGLTLDGVQLKPAKVSWQNEDQLRFVLREGRKRQIRRMCELVGLAVTGLKRVRIGSVKLGKLPVGEWRYLQVNERF